MERVLNMLRMLAPGRKLDSKVHTVDAASSSKEVNSLTRIVKMDQRLLYQQ